MYRSKAEIAKWGAPDGVSVSYSSGGMEADDRDSSALPNETPFRRMSPSSVGGRHCRNDEVLSARRSVDDDVAMGRLWWLKSLTARHRRRS